MISSALVCREMIARSSELDVLLACLRPDAARSSSVVVVCGEAGIGKSRLVREFAAAAQRAGARVVTATAREYANAPYGTLVEALEALGAHAHVLAEQRPRGDGADERGRRYSETAAQLEEFARNSPGGLAIVFEDVHWADGGTLEVLRFLAPRFAQHHVTFVATYRSDVLDADPVRAGAIAALERDAAHVIALEPLAGEQIERLLRSILRDAARTLSPTALAELRELADGRPLFAEELLRGVLERIDRDGDARALVPTSIRATVRERFGSLAPEERDVLVHAAVVGRRFSARFLMSLAGLEATLVFRALRRARDLQLVVEQRSDDGDAFAFRHALTREVVYGEMLRAETRELHARVAAALAREPVLDVAAIAEHAYRARDAEHALAWGERAGDEALALYAYADAGRHFERCIEFATLAADLERLARKAAEAFYAGGDLERTTRWLTAAIGDGGVAARPEIAPLAIRRARVLWELGRYDESIVDLRRLAAEMTEPGPRVEALVMLAGLLIPRGRFEEALEQLRLAAPAIGDAEPRLVTLYHSTLGYVHGLMGDAAQARAHFALAIAGAREQGDDNVLLRMLNNNGNVELAAGTVAAARQLYADALTIAERTKNFPVAVAWLAQNAALAALVGGDLAEARSRLKLSRSIAHDVAISRRWVTALTLRIATLAGEERAAERADAERELESALADADEQGSAGLGGALAFDAIAEHRPADAAAFVRRALAVVARPDAPYWVLNAATRIGEPADRDRARAALTLLAAREGALGARGLLALADARRHLGSRRREDAAACARAAAEAFRGAGWLIEEAEALELAGRVAEALALLRRAGALGEVRRLTETAPAPSRRRGDAGLTAREREIVGLLVAGRTARGIADELVISERTVETHVAAAYRKLGVSNRQELAAILAAGRAH